MDNRQDSKDQSAAMTSQDIALRVAVVTLLLLTTAMIVFPELLPNLW